MALIPYIVYSDQCSHLAGLETLLYACDKDILQFQHTISTSIFMLTKYKLFLAANLTNQGPCIQSHMIFTVCKMHFTGFTVR